MKRQVHKLVVMVVDHDDLGGTEVRDIIEHNRYPNHCMSPRVMLIDTREVEWSDDHPLNRESTQEDGFDALFGNG
jgi:hypothetical protein